MRLYQLISVVGQNVKTVSGPAADLPTIQRDFSNLITQSGEGELQIVELQKLNYYTFKKSGTVETQPTIEQPKRKIKR